MTTAGHHQVARHRHWTQRNPAAAGEKGGVVASVGGVVAQQPAREVGSFGSLLALPGIDPALGVTTQVIAPRGALLGAQLLIGIPGLVVDTDHAAGRPLRRHVDRVADWLLSTHPQASEWVSKCTDGAYTPALQSKHAERPANETAGDLKGLVPRAHSAPMTTSNNKEDQ